jgi:uncharacterized protein YbcV (DUF1398 family)
MQAAAKAGQVRATVLAYNARVQPPDTSSKSDAVAIEIEHRDGHNTTIYFPYKIKRGGVVTFAEPFAVAAPHQVFGDGSQHLVQGRRSHRRLAPTSATTANFPARTDMDADAVTLLAKTTLEGSLPFPQIVGELIAQGVEYYHVDYASKSFTFYSTGGAATSAPLSFEGLPPISQGWNESALKEAILDSQQNGQKFRQFCARAMSAGVQGYFAFLRGQRVTYLGRNGDQHVEWFPGARPNDA